MIPTLYRYTNPRQIVLVFYYVNEAQISSAHTPRTLCCFVFLKGVGTVVSGTTLRGLIRLNDTMLLGPDPLGSFIPIAVKSIHRKRMPVKEVRGGQTASFALKKVGGIASQYHHVG